MISVKYYLRKRKLWIAMICVLFCSALITLNQNEVIPLEKRELSMEALDVSQASNVLKNSLTFNNVEYHDDPYVNKIVYVGEKISELVDQENYTDMNRHLADFYLLQAERIAINAENYGTKLLSRDYLLHRDKVKTLIKQYDLPEYRFNYDIADYYALNNEYDNSARGEADSFPAYDFMGRFYDALDQQNIDTLTYSTTTSGTLFIQFVRNLFPLLPISLIALLFFDCISEDQESGVLKTILSQSISRIHYINKKLVANIIMGLCVFFIPLGCFSVGMGIFDHFKTLQAPILANVQGVTSLTFMENPAADPITNRLTTAKLGLSEFFPLPQKSLSPNSVFDLMPVWQFTLLCVVMVILILIFCILLNMLLNVLFKNKFVSLVLSIVVIGVGMAIVSPTNYAPIFAFLPFTFMNPVDILSGLSTYTYLNGILVLSIDSLMLYSLILFIFRKKDIA